MPWFKVPRQAPRQPANLDEAVAEFRVLRATLAAQASTIASLATNFARLDARLEAVMTNGLPAHVCPGDVLAERREAGHEH